MILPLLVAIAATLAQAQDPTSPGASITTAPGSSTTPAITAAPKYTDVWINQLAEYSHLPTCVQNPLSQIVRGMSSGCGDGQTGPAYSSFTCFCTQSSSTFNWIINSAVFRACSTDPAGGDSASLYATTALQVFHSYCELPIIRAAAGATTLSGMTTVPSTAVPGSGTSAGASNTNSPNAADSGSAHGLSREAVIGIGVGCGVGAVVLLVTAIFAVIFCRRSRRRRWSISHPIKGMATTPSLSESPITIRKESEAGLMPPPAIPKSQFNDRRRTPMVEAEHHDRHELSTGPPSVRGTAGTFFIDNKPPVPPKSDHPSVRYW